MKSSSMILPKYSLWGLFFSGFGDGDRSRISFRTESDLVKPLNLCFVSLVISCIEIVIGSLTSGTLNLVTVLRSGTGFRSGIGGAGRSGTGLRGIELVRGTAGGGRAGQDGGVDHSTVESMRTFPAMLLG